MQYMKLLQESASILGKQYVSPSTPEKIAQLEIDLGYPIPLALKEFFLLTGEDYMMLVTGPLHAEQSVNALLKMQSELAEFMIESGNVPFDNVLVFTHSIELFSFVHLNEGDNPIVYSYDDVFLAYPDLIPYVQGFPIGTSSGGRTFQDFIEERINEELALRAKYEHRPALVPVETTLYKDYHLRFANDNLRGLSVKNVYLEPGFAHSTATILIRDILVKEALNGNIRSYLMDVKSTINGATGFKLNRGNTIVSIQEGTTTLESNFHDWDASCTLPTTEFVQILEEFEYFWKLEPLSGRQVPYDPSNDPLIDGLS
jgi:hypothetical protein